MSAHPPGSLAQLPAWAPETDSEESRGFLQERLVLFAQMIFIIFGAAVLVATALRLLLAEIHLDRTALAHGIAVTVATLLGGAWLLLRWGGPRPLAALLAIDAAIALMLGVAFGAGVYLLSSLPDALPGGIVFLAFAVFGRALIVPSSPRRTCALSITALAPLVIAAVLIAIDMPPALYWPAPVIVAAPLLASAAAALLATVGSRVIYGLRQEVREARQLGQYTLDEKIGEGGMGTVYKATHAMLRRPTAVKLLRPELAGKQDLERFEREVQLTSELTHPNTVAIFDYGCSPNGVFYYVMEYLDGIDLERLVRRYGPQPEARVVHLLRQVCGALAEAHGRGLIHRDIKPANILLCQRGLIPDMVKVVDFGLAKQIDVKDRTVPAGIIAGTPAYLAPEVMRAPETVGPASDLYAVGAVGYYLLTGDTVFSAETTAGIYMHHLRTPPTPPSQRMDRPLASALEPLLLQCLAKDPAQRPASAEALAEALARLQDTLEGWSVQDAHAWWRRFEDQRRQDIETEIALSPTVALTVDWRGRTQLG